MLTAGTRATAGKGLDGIQALRFMAAMLVVAMHLTESFSAHGIALKDWKVGAVGVDIFFVISGFVMALSTPNVVGGWHARISATASFIRRRLVRLLPLYWFYTSLKILSVILLPALALRTTLEPVHLLGSFLLFPVRAPWGLIEPVLPVGWTLCLEFFFYLVFALAILFGAPRLIFCLFAFGAVVVLNEFFPGIDQLIFYQNILLVDFLLGLVAAFLWNKSAKLSPLWPLLGAGTGFYLLFGEEWVPGYSSRLAIGLAAGLIVWGVAVLEPFIRRFSFLSFVKHLGDASYSTYLSHGFIVPLAVSLCTKVLPASVFSGVLSAALFILVMLCCALAGSISYLCIERPMAHFFRRKIDPALRVRPT